jgi:hypothetical protein
MTRQETFSNRCPHCGYWLPPNQAGPCPNCGRQLHSVLLGTSEEPRPIGTPTTSVAGAQRVIKLTLDEAIGIRDEVVSIVNTSGTGAGLASSPAWPAFYRIFTEKMDSLEKKIESLPELEKETLEKHDKDKEARERTLENRLRKIAEDILNPGTWFWMIVSAIVGSIVVLLVLGR